MVQQVGGEYYCTNCGSGAEEEVECCGTNMIARSEAEGFGLSDFEPAGTNSYDIADEWN
jgi:hypothetical protein